MGKRSAAGLLTSVDSIFTTQEERDNAQRSYVTDLSAAEISDFPNHPFKVRMDQSMVELADSVKQYGVLVPSLVRPMPDGSYQMVSGHRRKRAAESETALFFYENEKRTGLRDALAGGVRDTVSLMVGPEGGFDPAEARAAVDAGLQSVSLGTRILRCETAPIAALAAVLYAGGNM